MNAARHVLLITSVSIALFGCSRLSSTSDPSVAPLAEHAPAAVRGDTTAARAPARADAAALVVAADSSSALQCRSAGAQEGDSLLTEWLLDRVSEPLDSLETPGADVPDLSDSLAAATEARLPSVDEIFDYPVVINRRVLAWIDAYLGKGRRSFENSLQRSGRYLAMARRIFREEDVPQDLAFLAHVESGFRHNAKSRAKALGLWQFMRGTARLCGLRCDSYVDERLDPEKSTRAAACHLRDLHEEFDDWYLALAAYNTGAGKVRRAIRRSGTRDFWRIARTRHLYNETRNFVPAILAATILAKSPGAYGLTRETEPPLSYESVAVDTPTDLRIVARCTDVPLSELQTLNPALLLTQTPPNCDAYLIRVPVGSGERFAREIARIPPEERLVYFRHMVRKGETLGLLARRYRTTVGAIQDANGLGRSTLIRIGQTLQIPSRSAGDWLGVFDWTGQSSVVHEVGRGESLSRIAEGYGSSVRAIQQANHLTNPHRICVGQLLKIPVPEAVAAERPTRPEPEAGSKTEARSVAGDGSAPDVAGQHELGVAPGHLADSLGRVPSTAHIVEEARRTIREQAEREAAAAPAIYTVRRGDTLSGIAARHGVRVRELTRWNGLSSSSLIHPGQQLMVSAPSGGRHAARPMVHIVERGDSLWSIAQRYGVRVSDLATWNEIGTRAIIRPGQRLRLN
ncbi:MAG: LysM peptidoglycan-binding domain-containing protein [Candidatus Eisenbacteria bacterium]|nr:LysM peptidoglycan-binding domain-containing protein [Candidatus Eisenbacteria bacterium]